MKKKEFIEMFKKLFGFDPPEIIFLPWQKANESVILHIAELDRILSGRDKDYDWVNCTYVGKPISLSGYVKSKYGNEAYRFVIENI